MVEPGQLSLKVTGLNSVPTVVYVQTPVLVFLVWLPTQVMAGNCVSFTVTVKLQVAVLFEASVTVHVTVVTPLLNTVAASVPDPEPVVTPVKT